MFPRPRNPRRLAVAAFLLALATAHSGAAPFGIAEQRTPPSSAAYARLAEHVRVGEAADAAMLEALTNAWHRSPDLESRLATLALNQTRLRSPSPSIARARLAAWAGDLEGHRVLAADGHAGHAAISALLVERIAATGDGSPLRPRSIATAGDALAFLRLRGAEPVGGYYGTPNAFRLTLIVEARHAGDAGTRTHHFDLSTTLGAWQDATAWANAGERRPPRTLVEAWATLEDQFALTSAGFLHATQEGESGHYAAAKLLTRAAEAGNGVARYALADLYLRLAESRPEVAEAATAAAREHHRIAAGLGLGYARLKLGLLARRDGDPDQAMLHLQAAHEAGEDSALLPLVAVLRPVDRDRADALLLDAARAGRADAAYQIAVLRLDVDEVTDPEALAVLTAAAEAGHAPSRLFLGDLLATGRHLAEDRTRARVLWTSVVDHGETPEDVLPAARALTLNSAPALRDPAAAARGLERLLALGARSAHCGECWLALADAHRALGDEDGMRRVLARAEAALRSPEARRVLAAQGPELAEALAGAAGR
jgi:TPR repeat protein